MLISNTVALSLHCQVLVTPNLFRGLILFRDAETSLQRELSRTFGM